MRFLTFVLCLADFVLQLFTALHDGGVVEVDGFRTWKEDDDDETAGKVKAIIKVNSYLAEMIEAADADEEEDEE